MLKKAKKALLKAQSFNRHHILPSSKNGSNDDENIAIINIEKHRRYHMLFTNRTPDEIVNYLIDYFWNGQTKWVFEAIAKREEEKCIIK